MGRMGLTGFAAADDRFWNDDGSRITGRDAAIAEYDAHVCWEGSQ